VSPAVSTESAALSFPVSDWIVPAGSEDAWTNAISTPTCVETLVTGAAAVGFV
jgi:hypothetical protein